jgi:membrane protein implicated in regulation of membrane protease activity
MLATDPLSLLFMACFLFGLLFLVVAALLGSIGGHGTGHTTTVHHIDVGGHEAHASHIHDGHSIHPTTTAQHGGGAHALFAYINPTSLVLFLLGFGFFGYVFHNTTSLALPLSLSLAVIGGLVIATLLLMLISRIFGDSEGATVQDVSDRTGLVGKVNLTIQENGIGEVLYVSPGGMRKSIPARSVDGRRLERDQEVVVVNYQHGVAEVDTWDHFVNQEEPGSLTAPTSADGLEELRALLAEPDSTDTEYVMRKDSSKE